MHGVQQPSSRKRILTHMQKFKEATARQIADSLSLGRTTVTAVLRKLWRDGVLSRNKPDGAYIYTITEEGKNVDPSNFR